MGSLLPDKNRRMDLEIGGFPLRFFKPPSIDALLDAATDADDLPFWAHLWDSAVGLGGYLSELKRQSPGRRRVLELGCGIGAVGCVAAKLDWDVVMTDFNRVALEYAAANLKENGVQATLVRADWREFCIQGRFDLVVGSDVLYESDLHPALAGLLGPFRASGARLLFADPGRPSATRFAAEREQDGWPVQLEFRDGRDGPIAIYLIPPGMASPGSEESAS